MKLKVYSLLSSSLAGLKVKPFIAKKRPAALGSLAVGEIVAFFDLKTGARKEVVMRLNQQTLSWGTSADKTIWDKSVNLDKINVLHTYSGEWNMRPEDKAWLAFVVMCGKKDSFGVCCSSMKAFLSWFLNIQSLQRQRLTRMQLVYRCTARRQALNRRNNDTN